MACDKMVANRASCFSFEESAYEVNTTWGVASVSCSATPESSSEHADVANKAAAKK